MKFRLSSVLLAGVVSLVFGGDPPNGDLDLGVGDDGEVIVDGNLTYTRVSLAALGIEYLRSSDCALPGRHPSETCKSGVWADEGTVTCDDGARPLAPLARRERVEGGWSPWVVVSWSTCPGDPGSQVELTIREVARLPVAEPTIVVQPAGGRALIQMETIFHAPDAGAQGFSAEVVGQVVDVVVRPVAQEWDFGDGARWTGNDPGAPWPDFTVHRVYEQTGTFTSALTTTWAARYRVDGGAWSDIDGSITTDVMGEPVEIVERRAYLLAPE